MRRTESAIHPVSIYANGTTFAGSYVHWRCLVFTEDINLHIVGELRKPRH